MITTVEFQILIQLKISGQRQKLIFIGFMKNLKNFLVLISSKL